MRGNTIVIVCVCIHICAYIYNVYMCVILHPLPVTGETGMPAHLKPRFNGRKLVSVAIGQGDRLDHELLGEGADEGGRKHLSASSGNHVVDKVSLCVCFGI